jgi:hypothetical protein
MRVLVFRVVAGDNNEAVRIPHGQRREQEGIDDAEDCGVRTDAGRKSEYGDGREAGALRKHAESVADVLPQIFHRCTSDDDRGTQHHGEMFSFDAG